MSAGCQLQQIQPTHTAQLHSRKVAEGTDKGSLLIIDDQRSTALGVASISRFAHSTSQFARVLDLLNIGKSVDGLEDLDGSRGFGDLQNTIVGDNERNLRNLLDSVSSGHHQSGRRRSGQGRDNGKTSLVLVDFAMPSAIGLGGCKHSSTSAHVSEGTLSGAVGTTTSDAGNTRHGTTCSPRLC